MSQGSDESRIGPIDGKKVAIFGGTFAPLLAVDILGHGGIGGGILCTTVALAATQLSPLISPVVSPYIKEVREAFSARLNATLSSEGQDDVNHDNDESTDQTDLPSEEQETQILPVLPTQREDQRKSIKKGLERGEIFPPYPPGKTLRLGTVVATGQRFDPAINDLLGLGVILAGSQGSGKSVAVAVIMEQIGEREMSLVIFDMKREYSSILSIVANGIVACHPDTGQDFHGMRSHGLTVDNAEAFAADIMQKGYQAVIDIPSFLEHSGNDWNLVAQIITAMLNGLMRWSIARKKAEDRLPCLVCFDEAHIFFPQNPEMRGLFDQSLLNSLNATAFSMVNMGRSYGYTMLFATQRIANIAKWTIGNCQIKVIMRHSVDVDLERCSKEIGKDRQGKPYATEHDIKTLPPKKGYGYVLGFTQEPHLIQFDMRRSYHPSNTPTIDRVQKRKEQRDIPIGETARSVETTILTLSPMATTMPLQPTTKLMAHKTSTMATVTPDRALQIQLEKALRLWNEGYRSTERLESASGFTRRECRYLLKLLFEHGLIEIAEHESVTEPLPLKEKRFQLGRGIYISEQDFNRGVQLRREGLSTGYRDLMESFNLSEHHAKVFNGLIRDVLEVPEASSSDASGVRE